MKKLLFIAVVGLGLTSCAKENHISSDTIVNQGTGTVLIDGVELHAGQKNTRIHQEKYIIVCGEGCKVNINGALIYQSTTFINDRDNSY